MKRDKTITVRLSPVQYDILYKKAGELDVEVSQAIRMLIESTETDPKRIMEDRDYHKIMYEKKKKMLDELETKKEEEFMKKKETKQENAKEWKNKNMKDQIGEETKRLWFELTKEYSTKMKIKDDNEKEKIQKKILNWIEKNIQTVKSNQIRNEVKEKLQKNAKRFILKI